jgi:hypothetical protein
MGLIKELVLLPVAPMRFTMWVGEKVSEEVDRQQFSQPARMQQLREIDEARDRGAVDEEAAAEAEAEIIAEETVIATPTGEQEEAGQDG